MNLDGRAKAGIFLDGLMKLNKKYMIPENSKSQERKLEQLDYPASEDIFNQQEQIPLDSHKAPAWLNDSEPMEQNLDVPGAELDDKEAFVGSEDEENNYWSLGGDNHEDLEQPQE